MASETTPQVRLVRCPKCRLVLPEVADVPVYECGGCGTILVAKNRKAIAKSTSVLQETEAAHANKLVHVSENGESSSSTPQEVLPSPPKSHLSEESGGNQNISSDSHTEEHGENLSIEGQHNDHYEKDQNTSSDTIDRRAAKYRKAIAKSTSVSQKTEAAQANKLARVSENGESSSSTTHEVLPSRPESHLSQESGGDQNISSDSHTEEHGKNLSIEGQHNDHYGKDQNTSSDTIDRRAAKYRKAIAKSTSVSQETEAAHANKLVHVSENGESSSSTTQEVLPSPPESHLSQESGGDQSISSDSQTEERGEHLSIEGQHNYEKDQNTSSDRDGDCDKLDVNRSKEGQQNVSERLQFESLEYCNVQQPGVSVKGSLSTELHHENEDLMLLAGANLKAAASDKTSQLEGANSELETNNKRNSNIRGLSIDNSPGTGELNSTVTACAAAGKVISSDNLVSAPDEHLEQPQKSEHHGFDRVRSTDTFETADFVSPSSELSGPLEYLSKSTTTRSSHAYDGSVSSYDGMDDHFPDQQMHSFKNNYKAANYPVPEERHRRDKLPAKGIMNGNSGMRDYARNFSSDFSYKKHCGTEKYSKWRQDELLEPVMHHHPPRSWSRLKRDEYPSQIPFSQRASLHGYESAGPSRELHDESPFDSAFHPLEKAEYTEQENMKLLRMVYELQDQISKTCHLNGKANGRTSTDVPWRQNHFPSYYHQEPPEEEIFYPRYHGRHGQRSSCSRQSRFSPVPFSGGAINTRHHIDNSCLCCHPQDWQPSEELPPPIFRNNRGFCRGHPGHSCYNSYSSCPSTPQRYLESDFSIWSHFTKSDDQRYKGHELKRYLREKHHSVRQHLRPTAGGAPFVTCYHCFRPLQLPADFLLFKRRFHQLRCGACSKVLKFSLQNGIHIVPYELVAAEPPASAVEDCSDVSNVRILTSASCSHGCLQADPLSYSDDYGHSFCKSCSTDGDPVSHRQFHELQGNAGVRNLSCGSSNPTEQSKDFGSKQSQNKHKNSVETFDSAGPSSNISRSEKVSSEIEELPPRTGGSPLHRLMGYSSPSQMINGFEPSISGENSELNS